MQTKVTKRHLSGLAWPRMGREESWMTRESQSTMPPLGTATDFSVQPCSLYQATCTHKHTKHTALFLVPGCLHTHKHTKHAALLLVSDNLHTHYTQSIQASPCARQPAHTKHTALLLVPGSLHNIRHKAYSPAPCTRKPAHTKHTALLLVPGSLQTHKHKACSPVPCTRQPANMQTQSIQPSSLYSAAFFT